VVDSVHSGRRTLERHKKDVVSPLPVNRDAASSRVLDRSGGFFFRREKCRENSNSVGCGRFIREKRKTRKTNSRRKHDKPKDIRRFEMRRRCGVYCISCLGKRSKIEKNPSEGAVKITSVSRPRTHLPESKSSSAKRKARLPQRKPR
jgi:hypothetical protein